MRRETLARLWETLEEALVAVEDGLFELKEFESLRAEGQPPDAEEQIRAIRDFEDALDDHRASPTGPNRELLRDATRALYAVLSRRTEPAVPVRLGPTIYAIDPARGALHRYEPSEIPDLRALVAQPA